MIDTHAHLDACAEPAEVIVARARAAGVGRIVSVGSGLDSCRETLAIAAREQGVFAALGIHPHQAADADAGRLDELRELLADERAVAVGETGLDFYRDYAPHDLQRELFARQLELAGELGKAVVVHTRAASTRDRRDARRLRRHGRPPLLLGAGAAPGRTGARLLRLLRRQRHVPEARRICARRRAQVPADRLLVETDSPYLSPQSRRGRPNEPANVVHTAAALAEARGEDPAELAARLDANATAAFSLA